MLVLLCPCSHVCVALSQPLHEAFGMGEQGKEAVLLPCTACWHGLATTTSVRVAIPKFRSLGISMHGT